VEVILRKLRVQHFRCFRNPVELSGLGAGIHVIHAPNETGKSSLVLAVARALFDRHSTKDREIQQLRPWQTALSPRVFLEFETGGKLYRLEKAFLDDATSLLDEWTGSRFERLADSQRADELVRGFLLASGSGSGATKLGQWGLARLLWLNQVPERHELPRLDNSLKARLLDTVGVVALSNEEQSLLKAVEASYLQFFTPKKGKLAAGSELEEGAALVRTFQDEVARLMQRRDETAQHASAIQDTQGELADLAKEKADYEQQLSGLQARIEKEAKLEQQIALREKDVERQRQEQQSLDQKQRELLAFRQKVALHETLSAEKEPTIQQAQSLADRTEEAYRESSERLKTQRTEQEKAEQRQERGRLLEKARQSLNEQRQLEELLKQGTALEAAVETSRRKMAALKLLSESDVKRAEDAQRKQQQAQDKLEVQGIEVIFAAEKQQSIEWEAQGHTAQHKVAKGEQKVFVGVSAGELRIKGVGQVNVCTGAEEVERLQAEVEKHRKELTRRLSEHGVESLAALRAEWEAQQTVLRTREKHEGLLANFLEAARVDSVEALRERQREQAGKTGALAGQLNLSVDALATYEYLEMPSLAEELKVRKQEVKAREKAKDEAEAAYRKAEQHLRGLIRERDGAVQAAQALSLELQTQLNALGMPIEQLGASVEHSRVELERLENMVKGLRAQLPPPAARAAVQRQQLQDALARALEAEKKAREKIIRAETLISQAAADGLYGRLCEAEEKLALANGRYQQLQTRARAVESLRTMAQLWQEQVSRTFVSPIEKEVHARLEHIRGEGRREQLSLDPEFSGAWIHTSMGPRPLDSFSWGTQEQTLFALRLALGELLSKQGHRPEPQLVVLDDALVNTDAARHRRALELIERAGETLQVLILTAFPDRYRTLRGMKEFDLKVLTQEVPAAG
jgi:hypothetical protein